MLLSICIPTHNRKDYLKQTIQSILSSIHAGNNQNIEICISDNCSTDGTDRMINEIIATNPVSKIYYKRNDSNIGADLNYISVIKMASSEYCWFLGSDDIILPNGIDDVLKLTAESGFDIILFSRINCTKDMEIKETEHFLKLDENDKYDFNNQNDLFRYLKNARSLGAFFSYLSSIVFKKSKWDAVTYDPTFTGSAFSHAYMLLSFMQSGLILKYVYTPAVLNRGGNDSFLDAGKFNRAFLDLNGYVTLFRYFFTDPAKLKKGKNYLKRLSGFTYLFYVSLYASNDEEWTKIENLSLYVGHSKFKLRLIKKMKLIGFGLRAIYRIKKLI